MKKVMLFAALAIVGVVLLMNTTPAYATSAIGVNFSLGITGTSGDMLASTDSVGAVFQQTHWMNYNYHGGDSLNLTDNTGASVTGVTLNWPQSEYQETDHNNPEPPSVSTAIERLYHSTTYGIRPLVQADLIITSSAPAWMQQSFDIYLYSSYDGGGTKVITGRISIDSGSYVNVGTFASATGDHSSFMLNTNYVVYSATGTGPRTIHIYGSSDISSQQDFQNGFNAFQFVEEVAPVPEPAGLGLIGAALLFLKRRRS